MKKIYIYSLLTLLLLSGCSNSTKSESETNLSEDSTETNSDIATTKISAEKAYEMMLENSDVIVLDVRTEEEYASGYVENAMLLPYDEISEKAAELLPDKDRTILVYCRSGRRSAIAADTLIEAGYTSVYDLGGIIDWPYEVNTD